MHTGIECYLWLSTKAKVTTTNWEQETENNIGLLRNVNNRHFVFYFESLLMHGFHFIIIVLSNQILPSENMVFI